MATQVVKIMLVKEKGTDKFKCVLDHSLTRYTHWGENMRWNCTAL
jgi:hypothetical protein